MLRARVCLETYVGYGNGISCLAMLASLSGVLKVIPYCCQRYAAGDSCVRPVSTVWVGPTLRGDHVARIFHRHDVHPELGSDVLWATYTPMSQAHMWVSDASVAK